MRTTDQKEKVIQSRSEKDLRSSSAKSFKAMVGDKRMSIIVMNGESKDEVEKKLVEKFAEKITML
ncbi:MAG: hypothetical protein V7765_21270 [Oleispira sp.]